MRSYRWDDSDDEENVVSVMRLGAQVSVADARATQIRHVLMTRDDIEEDTPPAVRLRRGDAQIIRTHETVSCDTTRGAVRPSVRFPAQRQARDVHHSRHVAWRDERETRDETPDEERDEGMRNEEKRSFVARRDERGAYERDEDEEFENGGHWNAHHLKERVRGVHRYVPSHFWESSHDDLGSFRDRYAGSRNLGAAPNPSRDETIPSPGGVSVGSIDETIPSPGRIARYAQRFERGAPRWTARVFDESLTPTNSNPYARREIERGFRGFDRATPLIRAGDMTRNALDDVRRDLRETHERSVEKIARLAVAMDAREVRLQESASALRDVQRRLTLVLEAVEREDEVDIIHDLDKKDLETRAVALGEGATDTAEASSAKREDAETEKRELAELQAEARVARAEAAKAKAEMDAEARVAEAQAETAIARSETECLRFETIEAAKQRDARRKAELRPGHKSFEMISFGIHGEASKGAGRVEQVSRPHAPQQTQEETHHASPARPTSLLTFAALDSPDHKIHENVDSKPPVPPSAGGASRLNENDSIITQEKHSPSAERADAAEAVVTAIATPSHETQSTPVRENLEARLPAYSAPTVRTPAGALALSRTRNVVRAGSAMRRADGQTVRSPESETRQSGDAGRSPLGEGFPPSLGNESEKTTTRENINVEFVPVTAVTPLNETNKPVMTQPNDRLQGVGLSRMRAFTGSGVGLSKIRPDFGDGNAPGANATQSPGSAAVKPLPNPVGAVAVAQSRLARTRST